MTALLAIFEKKLPQLLLAFTVIVPLVQASGIKVIEFLPPGPDIVQPGGIVHTKVVTNFGPISWVPKGYVGGETL